jgi:hypothetical protein
MLYGTVSYDTKLKANHSNMSSTITWVYEDEDVIVMGTWGGWFKVKVQRPGPDPIGWVKKSAIDLDYGDYPDPQPGVQACFNGPLGQFCING